MNQLGVATSPALDGEVEVGDVVAADADVGVERSVSAPLFRSAVAPLPAPRPLGPRPLLVRPNGLVPGDVGADEAGPRAAVPPREALVADGRGVGFVPPRGLFTVRES
ncbi:MAG: hypothetical protein AAGD35_03315 [Actinomycetota bacterium]